MGKTARLFPTGRFMLRTPKTTDKQQAYPIYLYYYCGGKQIRESVGFSTKVVDWNSNAGELRASYGTDYKKRNDYLHRLLKKMDGNIFEYAQKNGYITPSVIKTLLSGDNTLLREDKGADFLDYAREVLKKKYDHKKIRVSTYKNGITNINQFEKFLKSREDVDNDIFIGDITEEIVRDFLFWELNRNRKQETVEKYLDTISKVCAYASEHGLLTKTVAQAIAAIELEHGIGDDTSKSIKYLTREELGRLVHLDRNTLSKRQTEIVDMFLFSFYACGLRISDIITLRWCDIDLVKREIDKTQVKTRGRNFVPLTEDALKILETWKGKHKVFVFGFLPDNFDLKDEEELRIRRNSITATINKSLRRISEIVQIDKKVTCHIARHSWAVNALEQGMPISMISELMGHSSVEITAKVYAQWTQNAKAETVRRLKYDF